MLEQELIEKVKQYLSSVNLHPVNNDVSYTGLRKDAPQADGSKKDMNVVSFLIDFDTKSQYGIELCAVYIDASNNELDFLITPYYMERIN